MRADAFFARRHRHVDAPVVEHRRSADPRRPMLVELFLPAQLAGRRRRRCRTIARKSPKYAAGCRPASGGLADRDRGPHAAVRLERPVHAAILQTQRIDPARSAADEHAVADDGRIRGRGVLAVEAERPLQFQVRGLRRGEPGLALEPIVGRRSRPRRASRSPSAAARRPRRSAAQPLASVAPATAGRAVDR